MHCPHSEPEQFTFDNFQSNHPVALLGFFLWVSFFFIEKIPEGDPEVDMARTSLFSRHPSMQYWPENHGFYFAKMKIEHVILLASFGGAMDVPLEDYFNASVE